MLKRPTLVGSYSSVAGVGASAFLLMCSMMYLLVYTLTYSLTYSPTYSLMYSLFTTAFTTACTNVFTDVFTGAFTDVFTDDLSDVFQKLRKLRIQGRMHFFEKVCQRREREQVLQNLLKHIDLGLDDALKDFIFFKAVSRLDGRIGRDATDGT